MIKHVGKHNDKKIAIVYREVPSEAHMALVVYTDTLPTPVHNTLIKVIESKAGQSAASLADALFQSSLPDGRNLLKVLHKESFLKKINTNQMIVIANAKSNVRLDELNKILGEMSGGAEAVKRLKEIDDSRGYGVPQATNVEPLNDKSIASQRLLQADKMAAEGEGLVAESIRLRKEAFKLDPTLKPKASKIPLKAAKVNASK